MKVDVPTESAIERVLEKFDFVKVQSVMQHLGWTWDASRVPTVEELRDLAKKLLGRLDPTQEQDLCGTGGLYARSRRGRHIRLAFELTSASECIPEPRIESV